MSKITAAEMEAWNQAATKWMEGLRNDIREEVEAERDSDVATDENFGRLAITVIINAIALAMMGIVLIKTGLLFKLGMVFTIILILAVLAGTTWMVFKWMNAITVNDKGPDEPNVVKTEEDEEYDEGVIS